jgi:phosphoribosylpyrophosphate synthetase
MKTTICVQSEQLNKEDVRALLQAIRLCEMATFPDKEIYIKVEVPEISTDDVTKILNSIKPPFKWGPKIINYGKEKRG